MKGLFLLMVSILIYLKATAAQVSFRLQAPPIQQPSLPPLQRSPPLHQPSRSKFSFGRFQPMVDAIFSRNNRYRRPAFHHPPVDSRPVNAKQPPVPVMKPAFHSFEQNHNLPKRAPTVPFPPPPPPRHLLPEEPLAYLQDGFGPPRANSIIQTSSNLEKENLEIFPELKPLEVNELPQASIQDSITSQPLIEDNSNSDKFFPVIKPPLQQNLPTGNTNQHNFEQFTGGKQLNSALFALNPVQLDPEAIFHFADHPPSLFDAEPLKPDTIIHSQVNTGGSLLDDSSIKGLHPPPFEDGSAVSFQKIKLRTEAPESQFFSISEPQIPDSFFQSPDHEPVENDVELVFSNSFPVANAGILPLANELPDEMQKFPPFI